MITPSDLSLMSRAESVSYIRARGNWDAHAGAKKSPPTNDPHLRRCYYAGYSAGLAGREIPCEIPLLCFTGGTT